jgi:hypothetical protein
MSRPHPIEIEVDGKRISGHYEIVGHGTMRTVKVSSVYGEDATQLGGPEPALAQWLLRGLYAGAQARRTEDSRS